MIRRMFELTISQFLSIFKGKWNLERLANMNALYKMRSTRGKEIIDIFRDLAIWGNMYVILSLKWPWFKIEYFIILIPFYVVGTYFIGLFDENIFKFWQTEREKQSIHANPYSIYVKNSLDTLLERTEKWEQIKK